MLQTCRPAQFVCVTVAAFAMALFGVVAPSPAHAEMSVVVQSATLGRGDEGPAVRLLQERLVDLRYWLGGVDGRYGYKTEQAVMAFQKVNGLARDGVAGPATMAALRAPIRPQARASADRALEVVEAAQVALLSRDGHVRRIFNASTGKASTPTPNGRFRIYRQINGWHTSALGAMYRPKYFLRGYAVHGSLSVPAYPASHGCVRINIGAADFLWLRLPVGTRVRIYDTLKT